MLCRCFITAILFLCLLQVNAQHKRVRKRQMNLPHVNQQAKQMDDFALAKKLSPISCSRRNGGRDVRIIKAICEAMNTGKK